MKENWAFFVSLIVILFLFTFELPYVIYTPGGAIDLNERITVENGYSSDGSFSMAYVSMVKGNIPFLLFSYIMPNWDIVSTDELKPDNESLDEMIQADHISLLQAQNNALYSAFTLLGREVIVKSQTHHIVYLSEEADTNLELFDELIQVNGKEIDDLSSIQQIVANLNVGDTVTMQVIHDGKEVERYAKVYDTPDGLKIGVAITTTYEYVTDPNVLMTSKSSESGPSGGLMMALSIYNQLVPEDITGGKKIIGTGTIDQDGNVGAIGGVKYKLIGASKKKADIFLVPEENYAEAIEVKNENNLDIRVISVKTLAEAIQAIS